LAWPVVALDWSIKHESIEMVSIYQSYTLEDEDEDCFLS